MNKVYISEYKKFYYEGEVLKRYDMHNQFLEDVKINKFIQHKRKEDKQLYLCVNFESLIYKSKNWTLNVNVLDKYYRE